MNLVKCNRVAIFLKQHKVDIVYLQETHLESSEVNLLCYVFKGEIYHASSGTRSAGLMIGIGVGVGVAWILIQNIIDPLGRFIIFKG